MFIACCIVLRIPFEFEISSSDFLAVLESGFTAELLGLIAAVTFC